VPIIGEGQGVCGFVHIDDAAGATAAALECPPGAYNIVDGNPSPQHLWLTAFARAAGAPAPPRVSEEEALRASGSDAVYYATRLRGASNEKARRELDLARVDSRSKICTMPRMDGELHSTCRISEETSRMR